jgi:hypothetical protein
LRFQQPSIHVRHLKQCFVAHISPFAAGKQPTRTPSARLDKDRYMRILETAAMLAMIVGAQTLAIGTILIH